MGESKTQQMNHWEKKNRNFFLPDLIGKYPCELSGRIGFFAIERVGDSICG
jgi:hypothetical protein